MQIRASRVAAAALVAFVGTKEVKAATPPVPERALSGLHDDVETIKGKHL